MAGGPVTPNTNPLQRWQQRLLSLPRTAGKQAAAVFAIVALFIAATPAASFAAKAPKPSSKETTTTTAKTDAKASKAAATSSTTAAPTTTAPAGGGTAQAAACTPNDAVTLDGKLDPGVYNFQNLNYTRDSGDVYTGLMSVVETCDYYYVGFQQAQNAKSNIYCAAKTDKNATTGCYQKFNDLVGSDYIGFEWSFGGRTFNVPVDIYSDRTNSGVPGGGDGGSVTGIAASAVAGFSGLHYNLNILKWADYENSPDHDADPANDNIDYVYASTAEVRLTKSVVGAGMAANLLNNVDVTVHNSPAAPLLKTSPARFIVCEAASPAQAVVGSPISIPVTVVENGQPMADANVFANVITPSGVTVTPATAKTGTNGKVSFSVTRTTPGPAELRPYLEINGTPGFQGGSGDIIAGSTCPATFVAQSVTPVYNLQIVKDVDKALASPGDTLRYTVTVTNPAGSDAQTEMVLRDPLPANTSFVSADLGGTFSTASNTITWPARPLPKGGAVTVHFDVRISPDLPASVSRIDNTAFAKTLQHPDEVKDDATTTLQRFAIGIEKSIDQPTAERGDTLNYTITVRNPGTGDLTGVVITDPMPLGITFVSADKGGVFNKANGVLRWELPNGGRLAVGASYTVTFKATVNMDAPTLIHNVATADSNETGPVDDAADTVVPVRDFDIAITKVVDRASAQANDVLTYTVKVFNSGRNPLTGVVVSDDVPAGISYIDGTANPVAAVAGRRLTWNVGNLGVGSFRTFVFQAIVNNDAPAIIVNVAVADSNETGPVQAQAQTVTAKVLPLNISRPLAPQAPVASRVLGVNLPRTGAEASLLVMLASGLLLMGAGAIIASRRRRSTSGM